MERIDNTNRECRMYGIEATVFDHRKALKITGIALAAIGATAIVAATAPVSIPLAVGLGVGGALFLLVGIVGVVAIRTIFPNDARFKPGVYNHCVTGNKVGELYIREDGVPILDLDVNDRYEAGKAHSHLLYSHIAELRCLLGWQNRLGLGGVDPKEHKQLVNRLLERLRRGTPEEREYYNEMEGMVDGFNEAKPFWQPEVTMEEMMAFTLLPDSIHLAGAGTKKTTVACTSVLTRDKNGAMALGRNLDWMGAGPLGAKTIAVVRHTGDSRGIVSVSVPGAIGVLTGMHHSGRALAMNVADADEEPTDEQGLPATILNQMALEQCATTGDFERFFNEHPSLGPYHVTVMAPEDRSGAVIHLKQKDEGGQNKVERPIENVPQAVFNNNVNIPGSDLFESAHRQDHLMTAVAETRELPAAARAARFIALPCINNPLTVQSMVMAGSNIYLRRAAAFAADATEHRLDVKMLLGRESGWYS